MIAISENLSQPCTTPVYSGGKSKEDLMEYTIIVLTDLGQCESQRREAWKAMQELIKLYEE